MNSARSHGNYSLQWDGSLTGGKMKSILHTVLHVSCFPIISVVAGISLLSGCAHDPNKAEKLNTELAKNDATVAGETVGVNTNGSMVVQRKVLMSEELRRLQNEVYELEDHVYGNQKYGSKGLYGVLKQCKIELSDKHNGGDGKLIWTEPLERVTDKEDVLKIGVDEKDKLVGVSEEFLKDRIERFRAYKQILLKREEEYQDKVEICQAELRSRKASAEKTSSAESQTRG
jgi:hypothetical protein